MSTPRAEVVRATIDRVLEAHQDRPGVELAGELGVVDSYVTKLRGGWRPTRVRDELWNRLRALDPQRPGATRQPDVFYDGVLFAVERMNKAIAELMADLRQGRQPVTGLGPRTPDELADEAHAALEAADAAAARPRAARGRRPA